MNIYKQLDAINMKKFNSPRMSLVYLSDDNVVYESYICSSQMCYGFDCPDCPMECSGTYHCEVFKCVTYKEP